MYFNNDENLYQKSRRNRVNPDSFTPNKKLFVNLDSPLSTGKFSTNYSSKYIKINNKYIFQSIYKTFHRDINSNNNKKNKYYSLQTNPNKLKNKFIIKSLQKNSRPIKGLLFSLIKTPKRNKNKNFFNKDNFTFIPNKYDVENLHSELMQKNKISIRLKQEKEAQKNFFDENIILTEKEKIRNKNICLTNESMPLFDKEYNKNKANVKKLILNEINYIGKKLSFANVKKLDDIIKSKDINGKLFTKRVKEKDPLIEINQVSNLPALGKDKNLVFNLWKKDMIKYCKLTLNMKNKSNEELKKKLLCVYN